MAEPGEPGELAEGTLISHLLELRDRLLKSMLAVGICFVPCAIYMNQLFTLVAKPLIHKLPAGSTLQVPTRMGSTVPLSTVADVTFGAGPNEIDRIDRLQTATVSARLVGITPGDGQQRDQHRAGDELPCSVQDHVAVFEELRLILGGQRGIPRKLRVIGLVRPTLVGRSRLVKGASRHALVVGFVENMERERLIADLTPHNADEVAV